MKNLTKKQIVAIFKEDILPCVKAEYEQDNRIDYPARREAWNNWLDSLRTDNTITEEQASYTCPW
jgi:hypothetical protein